MKIEKNKHNHKLTDLLKVGIFALLMIAPLLASVSQMLYVTFNKNAYLSTQMTAEHYHVEYPYETNEVNNVSDLVIGNIYKYNITSSSLQNGGIVKSNLLMIKDSNLYLLSKDDRYRWRFSYNTNNTTFYIWYDAENVELTYYTQFTYDFFTYPFDIYFIYQTYSIESSFDITKVSASDYLGEGTIVSEPIQALDNAFYYGVDKMTQSNLFNWTENTLLYTGIKGMTDNLGVQTNAIAILITYWTILTIIYVILDIVIKGFTFITHLIVRSE